CFNHSYGYSGARIDNWQPRASDSGALITVNFFDPFSVNKNSRYTVSLTDFVRRACIPPASSKIAREARNGAIAKIGGLLICQPSADETGTNSGSRCNRNRVLGSLPNQPASRGNFLLVA